MATRRFSLGDTERSGSLHRDDLSFNEARIAKRAGLTQFGVNHVVLKTGGQTALRHWHEAEDEFVYVIAGAPTLIDNFGAHDLSLGDYVGFPAGEANAHHIVNRSLEDAVLLVVGSRRPGEETIHYPDADFGPNRK